MKPGLAQKRLMNDYKKLQDGHYGTGKLDHIRLVAVSAVPNGTNLFECTGKIMG